MKHDHGFSLIEMAVVLFIVVLLLGSLLVPFATQVEQRRIAETQKTMEEIKEALIGYAASHGAPGLPYLPCPDTDDDGMENISGNGQCVSAEGNLPWVDLGVGAQDAWGNRFHYRVATAFADRPPAPTPGFDLNAAGDIRICSSAVPAAPGTCPAIATNIPAVIVSFGKNGRGALGVNGNHYPAPTTADELENYSTALAVPPAGIFVSRTLTTSDTPAGEFDDLVVWLSPNVLFNRMVAAQRLP